MKTIEVCLTPDLIHQHSLQGKIVIIVDIFRATSCIITGLASGVQAIYPVGTVEECLALGDLGMLTAGERGGKKIEGFMMGNSPYDYLEPIIQGKKVAITTTNGTLAINKSKNADEIIIGAFLNISATAQYLKSSKKSLIVHCAGWQGSPNIEDTIYAGAIIHQLKGNFEIEGDSAMMAHDYYQFNADDLLHAATQSGHAKRLAGFGITKDAAFCMQLDRYDVVVKLMGDYLSKVV